MTRENPPVLDVWQVVLQNPGAAAAVVIAVAAVLIVLVLLGPLRRALDSIARRGGKLPGGIELNAEITAQSEAVQTPQTTQTFDTVTQALLGPVIDERVRNFESGLRLLPEPEQRRALLLGAAREQVTNEFQRLYRVIYGSQIAAMKGVNLVGRVDRAMLEGTYNGAAARDPDFYKHVPFEHWLGFLTSQIFLRQDDGHYSLTNRGQLFLHFLVQESVSEFGLPHNSQR